ncbi:MAG TPA: ribokinase [Geminicoccaceae bacterium]|jgi:ribokinase|nr:ribokinase [Geminicoccaceae bacterium]
MLLVFGSLNVDLVFQVASLPRPGETVLCPGYALAPGGKGANQATAAAKAGASVRMVGHLGEDDFGRLARRALLAAGVNDGGIATSARATGIAVIGVDRRGENQIMVASGANLDTDAGQIADAELTSGITVLCQNEIRPEATFALLERAKARGARAILNLAPAGRVPDSVLDALDVLLVNEIEAATAAGGRGDPADLARELAARHGLTCIVTVGSQGALAVGPADACRVPALAVETIDTTGAGDAFAGVLAAALDRGLALTEALRHASVAAGLACTRLGAQTSQPDAAAIAARLGDLGEVAPLA